MSVFNISNIALDDTFEIWFDQTNDVISNMNLIQLLDAQGDTTQGIEETYRNGGVVIFGITTADGLGFNADGQLTLSFAGVSAGIRTGVDDIALLINPNDGSVKGVSGVNIIPPQVDNDINFTGDVSFSGDLSFITTGSLFIAADAAFRDKQLELAVNFDDELEFATVIDSLALSTSAYLVDSSVVGDDFASFNSNAESTWLGKGIVLSEDLGNSEITVTNFFFTSSGDTFQEFTVAGATAGGRYSLIDEFGTTLGRGLLDHDAVSSPEDRQTLPTNANDAGIVIRTSDGITQGGFVSSGQKKLTWIYNGTSADSAWVSSENLQLFTSKALISRNFISPDSDRFEFQAQSSEVFHAFTTDGRTQGYASYYNVGNDTLSIGGFTNTTTFASSLQFNRDETIVAGTTGLAENLNADLLDGAHGSTTGGANTVPISGSDGTIDGSYLPFTSRIEETISQTAHGLEEGMSVRKNESGDFVPSIATTDVNATAVGIVADVVDVNTFTIVYVGIIETPEIAGFSLGLGYGGATVALDVGNTYYLSETISGGITTAKPVGTTSITKPMFVALEDKKLIVLNTGQRPSPTGDTIDVTSVVPIGSISFVGANNIGSNNDFLTCDGKVYSSMDYPDLKPVIQGQFYLEAGGTGGTSTITVDGDDSETRNFEVGQTFQLQYNDDANSLAITLASVTPISSGVALGFAPDILSGSEYIDDIEIRGTGVYFVVPDLRSRGVIGSGNPDGASNGSPDEGDFTHGDIVEAGGGSGIDQDFEILESITVAGAGFPLTIRDNLPAGKYIFHGRYEMSISATQQEQTSTVALNGITRTHRFITNNGEKEAVTIPTIVEVLNGRLEITGSSNINTLQGGIGYRIQELESQPFTGYQTFYWELPIPVIDWINFYPDETIPGRRGTGLVSFTNLRPGLYSVDVNLARSFGIDIEIRTQSETYGEQFPSDPSGGGGNAYEDVSTNIRVGANGELDVELLDTYGQRFATLVEIIGSRIGD